MMIINLASSHMHANDRSKCMDTLDSMDWSGTAENYKICVAALKDDVDEVCRLMPIVKSAETISAEDFRIWPVFSFVRKNSTIRQRYLEVFGSPLDSQDLQQIRHEENTREKEESGDQKASAPIKLELNADPSEKIHKQPEKSTSKQKKSTKPLTRKRSTPIH